MLRFIERESMCVCAVAIVEIGYNLINELEEEYSSNNLVLHQQKNPIMIYLSHENKTKGIERFEEILNQDYNKYDVKKIPQ